MEVAEQVSGGGGWGRGSVRTMVLKGWSDHLCSEQRCQYGSVELWLYLFDLKISEPRF